MAWWNNPISHGYISSYQGPGTDTPHYAVDLAAPFHTPFSFPKSGTIAQADYAVWSGAPGGGEVFLKPDDGSTEQYVYHLDEIDVRSGQHVAAGQQVGLSGGQNQGGEHPTSFMWSSGPHIHYGFFQKYINTPAGGRPYGPDPTNYVQSLGGSSGLSSGGELSSSSSPFAFFPPQGSSSSSGGFNILSLVGLSQDNLIRGALIISGAILMIMGLHSLLQKGPQINIQAPGKQQGQPANNTKEESEEETAETSEEAGEASETEAAEAAEVAA